MSANFYVLRSGESKELGPFTLEELRDMRYSGQLDSTDCFWREGMAQWASVTDLPREGDRTAAAVIRLPGKHLRPTAWDRVPRMVEVDNAPTWNPPALVGLAGASLLILGPFCPLLSLPIVGSITYFNSGRGDGVIVLACGLLALLLAFLGATRALWLAGVVPTVMLGYFIVSMGMSLNDLERETAGDGKLFSGLAQGLIASIQVQWGAPVILIGAILCITASFVPTPRRPRYI